MKKLLTTLACVTTLASTLSADFTRLEMGGGLWKQSPNGTITYSDGTLSGTYTSAKKEKENKYVWLLLKHPVPVLPNIRLEYADISDKGVVTGSLRGFPIAAPLNTPATLELTEYDATLYYNILDNTMWTTLDLGLDVKMINAKYTAAANGAFTGYEGTESIALPLGYVRARVEIPATGLALEGDVKYVTYNGSTVSDIKVKVDYTFDLNMFVEPGIEVGYRVQKFDLTSDDSTTKIKMDFAGLYAGIMLRF